MLRDKKLVELYSIKKIKTVLKGTLKSYGVTLNNRFKLRLALLLVGLNKQEKMVTCEKASKIVGRYFSKTQEIMSLKQKAFVFLNKIKLLQRKWREVIKENNNRKLILKSKWQNKLKELIHNTRRLTLNSKGQEQVLSKLKDITDKIVEKSVSTYYEVQKRKYYKQLIKYFTNRENKPLESIKPLPEFEYIPSEKSLSKLILDIPKDYSIA